MHIDIRMFPFIAAFLSNWPVVLFAVLSAAVYYAKRNQQLQRQNQSSSATPLKQAQWKQKAPVQKVTPQPVAPLASGSSLPVVAVANKAHFDNSFSHSSTGAPDEAGLDLKLHSNIPCSNEDSSFSHIPVTSTR